MTFQNRLSAFVTLGQFLNAQLRSETAEFTDVLTRANHENAWFTHDNMRYALQGVVSDLEETNLGKWLVHYDFPVIANAVKQSGLLRHAVPRNDAVAKPKTVAVIMAGNLPLVGFRDFLAVLISGHKLLCKLSSKDSILQRYLAEKLIEIEPEFANYICFEQHVIKGFDAVIATGGNHAVEHFQTYFSKYPHIIRGHRNSVAILDGTENTDDLEGLFEDMFRYFGLGCRNVTKLFVPDDYDIQMLVDIGVRAENFPPLRDTLQYHHVYQNNYQYQTVVSALCARQTIDAGVFLLVENSALTPPISVVHYERYSDLSDVRKQLELQKNHIQCIVSKNDIAFGNAQKPGLLDYADGVDTMSFLLDL